MQDIHAISTVEPSGLDAESGINIWLHHATLRVGDGTELIGDACTSITSGQIVAIIGASGAGKSTLLDLLAGNASPTSGHVRVNGVDSHALDERARRRIGFVPQTVGTDPLPLLRSLTFAARLRMAAGTTAADASTAAMAALRRVHLDESADVPIAQLSGGQQRRAAIAVELVTDPDALLLDEPTSGLDPATGASLMDELRALADHGRTIVLTTHHPEDLDRCDRVIALSAAGQMCFDGTTEEAAKRVGTDDPHVVHRVLTSQPPPKAPAGFSGTRLDDRRRDRDTAETAPPAGARCLHTAPVARTTPSRAVQWWTLTRRTLAGIRHNHLTMGIMLGAPAAIIAMFAVLFRSDAFDTDVASPTPAIMIAFWVAFAGFFFGLTYGLLQVCPEVAEMRRERRAGVPAWLQILAKLTALGPILIGINTAMLLVLTALDRLPRLDVAELSQLSATLALDAVSALALGLWVSSMVRTPVQTSLALPLLCFPAVLFSGAMVPVDAMTSVGRTFSMMIPVRWAFDAVGQSLGLPALVNRWTPDGIPSEFGGEWSTSTAVVWLTLAGGALVFTISAIVTLARRLRPNGDRWR